MKRKSILLTNFNIINFSGSEIDTVTVANYFISIGYNVDIFTLDYGEPLSKIVNKNIRVVTLNNVSLLKKKYDLVWSHHYPLLDYLIFNQNIKANHIIYISLSSFEPLETLPQYYMNLSLIGALSDEAIQALDKQMPEKRNILKFPNYATNNFFKHKIKEINNVRKICIVSNHIPSELYDFKEIAEANNIKVDLYGTGNIIKYIDDKVLSKYDVIISIGKTVYYSIAMGKHVYCYDKFGGCGFITSKNIDKAFKYNFSGRGFNKKLTGEKIYNDIIKNYKKINKELYILKEYAQNNFNFENNVNYILSLLNKDNKTSCNDIIQKYPNLVIKSRLYVETYTNKNDTIKYQNTKMNNISRELEAKKSELAEIYTSTSWKITYPIRLLKALIYKVFKR